METQETVFCDYVGMCRGSMRDWYKCEYFEYRRNGKRKSGCGLCEYRHGGVCFNEDAQEFGVIEGERLR